MLRIGGVGPEGKGPLLVYRTIGEGTVRLIVSMNVQDLEHGRIQRGEAVNPGGLSFHGQALRERGGHAQPTLMLYEQCSSIESWTRRVVEARAPDWYSADCHGRLIELWNVEPCASLRAALQQIDVFTIADGHHRIEASLRACQRGENGGWFSAALARCGTGTVPAFHRIFEGGGQFCEQQVVEALDACGRVWSEGVNEPLASGQIALGLGGRWWRMEWGTDLMRGDTLEVELFESRLAPRLSRCVRGAASTSRHISVSVSELARTLKPSPGTLAVAFPPVSRALYQRRAQRGELLPPKSICFLDKPEFSILA